MIGKTGLPKGPLTWFSSPQDLTGGGLNLGIYTTSSVQRYIYGTRFLTWDGRVYKYCNAVAAVYSYWGAQAYEDAALSWTVLPSAGVVPAGSKHMVVTLGSRTENDLTGGYVMLYDASVSTTAYNQSTYWYGITGNNDTATVTTIYIDGVVPVLTTTSDAAEVFENPYRETKAGATTSAGYAPVVCIPCQSSAAGYKYWGQTYGPAYVTPTNTTLDDPTSEEGQVYFSGAGASGGLKEGAPASQHAGFILNPDVSGSGGIAGPMIMLQISI
jgi:hypothetical protein